MPSRLAPSFKVASVAPASHPNHGNWIVEFRQKDIPISEPSFQCYHINVQDGPLGGTFKVLQNNNFYDTVFPGWNTSWDPNNPMKLENGDTVSFWWDSATGTAPTVWLYFEKESPL